MKVTADTITDHMILRLKIEQHLSIKDLRSANDALAYTRMDGTDVSAEEWIAGRARCAEIWNARAEREGGAK